MSKLGWPSLLAVVALTGCATTTIQHDASLAPGARYVALGSSFAAGAGIGPTKPGTPQRCGRTTNNYATLLAERLNLALDDESCGGATTAHVLGPWSELPPQIEAVTADTRLVTLTAGGNDLNYVGTLFAASCDPAVGFQIQGRSLPCSVAAPTGPDQAALARLRENLRAIAAQVKARAPQARLVLVQYVTLVPPVACPAMGLSPEGATVARTIGSRLSAITAEVARETGALLLPADELSRGHTPCDRVPWAKARGTPGDPSASAPWHPNTAGHAAIAEALAKKLGG